MRWIRASGIEAPAPLAIRNLRESFLGVCRKSAETKTVQTDLTILAGFSFSLESEVKNLVCVC